MKSLWRGNFPISLEEAARRDTDVLSFDHPKYRDIEIYLNYKGRDVLVKSAVTTKYLMDLLAERGKISSLDFLKIRYGTGKIRTEYLDPEIAGAAELQKKELEELIIALDRFEASSWKEIWQDN